MALVEIGKIYKRKEAANGYSVEDYQLLRTLRFAKLSDGIWGVVYCYVGNDRRKTNRRPLSSFLRSYELRDK